MHSVALRKKPDCTSTTPSSAAAQPYFQRPQQKQKHRTPQHQSFIKRWLKVFSEKLLLTTFGHIETSVKRNLLKVFQSDKCNKYCKFPLIFFFSWSNTYTVYTHMHRQYKPLCAIELAEMFFIYYSVFTVLHIISYKTECRKSALSYQILCSKIKLLFF